jgi:hypothetical protein
MEQAEEYLGDDQFQFLRGRLRRANVPIHTCFIIANTAGHNWIYKMWKQEKHDEYELFEATTFDNKDNLPHGFVQDLERMKEESPHTYNRYVLNSWDDFETDDSLIPYEFIKRCLGKMYLPTADRGKVLAVDVARFGDDETVFTIIQDCGERKWKQVFLQGYKHRDLMETAGRIMALNDEHKPQWIVVDDDGLGGGVVDRLIEQGLTISRFRAQETPVRDQFWNKRTEQFWKLREYMRQGLIDLINDDTMTAQLSELKYKFKSNGKKFIEPKDEAKKRGVKSPDRADALMMACSVIPFVDEPPKEYTKQEQFWLHVKTDIELSKQNKMGLEIEEEAMRPI